MGVTVNWGLCRHATVQSGHMYVHVRKFVCEMFVGRYRKSRLAWVNMKVDDSTFPSHFTGS